MSRRTCSVRPEIWPIRGEFVISRGSKTAATVVVVEIREGEALGRGECVPYARYGESVDGVVAAIETLAPGLADGLDREGVCAKLPAGAARNAIDCALWDLDAKRTGRPVHEMAGLPAPLPVLTAFTVSLGTPAAMAAAAAAAAARPLLKLKLGGDGDVERVAAVRRAVPQARLIVDANEAWTEDMLARYPAELASCGVELIEQPLPAGQDAALAARPHPIPICADESCREAVDLERLAGLYDMVNLKLDKAGGLSGGIALAKAAQRAGVGILLGCMVSTSLSMAPAMLLAPFARFVDLDGPLLLARDRDPGLRFEAGHLLPAPPALWG